MPRVILLLCCLALAACATPRERCISQVSRDLRVLNGLAAEAQGNLARGYAIEEREEVRVRRETCRGRNEDGSTFTFRCDKTEVRTRRVPVSINLEAEAAKLRSLEDQITREEPRRTAAVQQCIATYPE